MGGNLWHDPVCIVGGGRWARVLARVLLDLTDAPLAIVSSRNADGVRAWARELEESHRLSVFDSLDHAFADSRALVGVVANLPAEHGLATRWLLEAGAHVLVEKPMVPTMEEAESLVTLARERSRLLCVGHEYLFSDDVRRLRDSTAGIGPVESVRIEWLDQYLVHRDGSHRILDLSTSVVSDLLPHVCSILDAVFGAARCEVLGLVGAGDDVTIDVRHGMMPVAVRLSRIAPRSLRRIVIAGATAGIEMDFTSEPARISGGSAELAMRTAPAPLAAMIDAFLASCAGARPADLPNTARGALDIVATCIAAQKRLAGEQYASISRWVGAGAGREPDAVLIAALRAELLLPLLRAGLLATPKDIDTANSWTARALQTIALMANEPFLTQREIAAQSGVTIGEQRQLAAALRECEPAQQLILDAGAGAKYWRNTIAPLARAGVLSAVLDRRTAYPFRVGIYAGVSCMFRCSFCGRVDGARYDQADADAGTDLLLRMIEDAPREDRHRFYLSGGLEPLTNPHLGRLVAQAADWGYQLSLYTNGLMLTPELLARQPGLWKLDALRISLYGVDAASARAVTRHSQSFQKVIENAATFLRLRDARGAAVRFGFNHVVLGAEAANVAKLMDVIARVNRESAGVRKVDFLTLREDYSLPAGAGFGDDETVRLREAIEELERIRLAPEFRELVIDYGYALDALARGAPFRPLEKVTTAAMRGGGAPQISVVVDLLGDVYLYREAGFLHRPGASRYVIGRLAPGRTLEDIVHDFVQSDRMIEPLPGDTALFDIFDHVVTLVLNQADADAAAGIPFQCGPVRARCEDASHTATPVLAHPTLFDPRDGSRQFAAV